ncbi:MAG: hypothetical protein MJE12_08300, partial [Alphaproteobacteria bacterium]|nr:hypothetical protein [Alphaproteobacteria bacterium]
ILRSVIAGVAALLFVQGSALAAVINTTTDPLEGTLTLDATNPSAFFSFSHPINGSPAIDDEFLINLDIGSTAVSSILFAAESPSDPAPGNPTGLDLELFLVDSFIGDVITFNTSVGFGVGSLVASGLVSGQQYLLKIVANANGQDIRSYNGQITATPLPPALLIFATGLFGMGWLARYRRRRQGQLGLQA